MHGRLIYLGGSSGPSDDAVDTLLRGEGVCRDYTHLVLALLRAQDVPARPVASSTCQAPRASMLRIATGRDAAAFLSVHHGCAGYY